MQNKDEMLKDLSKLQIEIDTAKKEKVEFETRLKILTQELKEKFGINDFEEAKNYIKEMQEKCKDLEQQIQAKYEKLKSEFEW